MCYLVRQKCKEEHNSSSIQSYCQQWDQLIETAVDGKPFLQVKLVEKLADCGNITEGCKYARRYYLAPSDLPDEVAEEMYDYISNYQKVEIKSSSESKQTEERQDTEESWDDECEKNDVMFSLSTGFVHNASNTWEDTSEQYYQVKLSLESITLVDT